MTYSQTKSMAEAIAAIAEIKEVTFWDVLADLVNIGTIDDEDFERVGDYMESL